MEINLFSPWYSWRIAELALNNNHSDKNRLSTIAKKIFYLSPEEEESSEKGLRSPETNRSAKTLHERAAARHSAKLQAEKPTR